MQMAGIHVETGLTPTEQDDSAPQDFLGELIKIAGQEGALKFIIDYEGRKLRCPLYFGSKKAAKLSALLGDSATKELIRRFGGAELSVPLAKPWRAQLLREMGWTYCDIAYELHVSDQTVWRWLSDRGMTNSEQPPCDPSPTAVFYADLCERRRQLGGVGNSALPPVAQEAAAAAKRIADRCAVFIKGVEDEISQLNAAAEKFRDEMAPGR